MKIQKHYVHSCRLFWCIFLNEDSGSRHRVATAGEDGSIGVWQVNTGEGFRAENCHRDETLRLANHSPGIIASGGADGMVKLWCVGENQLQVAIQAEVHRAQDDGQIYALLCTESEVLAAHDNRVTVFDNQSMQELVSLCYAPYGDVTVGGPRNPRNQAFTFDACINEHEIVVALSDGTIRCRDLRSPLRDAHRIKVHNESSSTCCSILEHQCLVGSGTGDVTLLDTRRWAPVSQYEIFPSPVYGARHTSKDSFLAWGNTGSLVQQALHSTGGKTDISIMDEHFPIYCVDFEGNDLAIAGGTTPEIEHDHDHCKHSHCGHSVSPSCSVPWCFVTEM